MKKNENRIISYVFLGIIFTLFIGIGLRIFTRTILVSRFKMNNSFTDAVFFDAKGLLATESVKETDIAWASEYPFADKATKETVQNVSPKQSLYAKASGLVMGKAMAMEAKVSDFATAYLPGYDSFVFLSNKYKNVIGWNFAAYSEYNGILELKDGYLSSITESRNIENAAKEIVELSKACMGKNISFMYVNAPEKLCLSEDAEFAGTVDYSNQNASELLKILDNNGVHYIDLRNNIHDQGLNHHSMYFKTDHHWIPETGLWAAHEILSDIAESFGFDTQTDKLIFDEFERIEYKAWFLGSQGKKVTLANTDPDDISLLMPNFETSLTIDIPSVNVHKEGDFSVTYDMDQITVRDYNKKSPYHAYCYGDRAVITITNNSAKNDTRLLIVRDSFGDVVAPFAALGVAEITTLDLRYFTGSLISFIDAYRPNAVIVLYGGSEIAEPEYESHKSLWDLR